jgi:HlyD family secretion protein
MTATRGNLISSISGTGQVSGSSQLDVKSKVSGDVVAVGATTGQTVTAGQLLAQIDARDAEIALETARIAYQKLVKPADAKDLAAARDNVNKNYNDVWNAISGTFLDLPVVSTGLKDLLYGSNSYLNNNGGGVFANNTTARDYRDRTAQNFDKAEASYRSLLTKYNTLSRTSSTTSIESFLADTSLMAQYYAETLKDARSAIVFLTTNEPAYQPTLATTAANNVNTWSTTMNSDTSSLLTAANSLTSSKNTLTDLIEGADSLDVASQQLSLRQKEQAYNDYFIRAPFAGIVGKMNVKVADSVSGSSVVATIVSAKKIADISLNEVDVSKISVGNKATLTFDAIEGLTISGEVTEIDQVGTVTQGVVTYNVKIVFDTDDIRIKPGMSVSAAIITEVKSNVLTVPNGAVKSSGGTNYVLVFDPPLAAGTSGTVGIASAVAPIEKTVEVGTSNDTETEILSGISEGQQVVSRTISATAASSQSAPSLFGGNNRTTAAPRTTTR